MHHPWRGPHGYLSYASTIQEGNHNFHNFYSVRLYPHFPTQRLQQKMISLEMLRRVKNKLDALAYTPKVNCLIVSVRTCRCNFVWLRVENYLFKLSSFVQIWKLTDISLHKKSHRYDASVWFEGARFGSRISTTRPWSVMQLVGSKFQPRSSFFIIIISLN